MNSLAPLVTVTELASLVGDPSIRVVDARFKMPGVLPTAEADHLAAHIPGAVFFDIDRIAATDTHLPHMLPDPAAFSDAVGHLGIGDADRIVLYDAAGIAGAARVWWTFRAFGNRHVSILDGGLKAWQAAGHPVEPGAVSRPPRHFTARFDPGMVRSSGQILADLARRSEQIVDARSAGRFEGIDPEPWPGRRSGHIPGSLNVDHAGLIDPATGLMRPPSAIRRIFAEAGVRPDRPVVTTCGSGVTACVLAFAWHLAGHDAAVFDGSWAEWGLDPHFPVETGPPHGEGVRPER